MQELVCEGVGRWVLKEEVSHAFIAVDEAPVEHLLRCGLGADVVSSSSYNAEQSNKDELLSTCFKSPCNDVRHALLSHNHIMLVLRASLSQAKWDIPTDAAKNLIFCDVDGRLSINAVAESSNGKGLGEVMQEGIQAELLSWRMDV